MTSKVHPRPLSAESRTISLFDGKMDVERKPGENRDGTALLERVRKGARPDVKWTADRASIDAWGCHGRRRVAEMRRVGNMFVVHVAGERRTFGDLFEAARWAEDKVR